MAFERWISSVCHFLEPLRLSEPIHSIQAPAPQYDAPKRQNKFPLYHQLFYDTYVLNNAS